MTPTLVGRIQSRLVLVLLLGGAWTLLVGPILPGPGEAPLSEVYRATFRALLVVAIVGIAWECAYHAFQQLRWEKDWPALLGLLTGINEMISTLLVLRLLGFEMPGSTFAVHFWTTWLLVWFVSNGPLRVVVPRWRFRGGRFI